MNPHSKKSPRGRPSDFPDEYSPDLLLPILRSESRSQLGIGETLPFSGVDIWNGYELSWLNPVGRPVVATGEFRFPATSPSLIESKSLKLYLNSLGGTRYDTVEAVASILRSDLGHAAGAEAQVRVSELTSAELQAPSGLPGRCIDDTELEISTYDLDPELLADSTNGGTRVTETLHSHLFKSNCPVTGQPDWASVLFRYRGAKIRQDRLLAYLVSYRNHAEFHEQCVERIFVDIQHYCRPDSLTVYARYTRRGGLDINPFRSNFEEAPVNLRLLRQ